MHTQVFNSGTDEQVTVNFNSDFSGNAVIYYKGNTFEIPAIVLTIGIAQLESNLFDLWELADNIKTVYASDELPQADF